MVDAQCADPGGVRVPLLEMVRGKMVVGRSPDVQDTGVTVRLKDLYEDLENLFPHADEKPVNI